MKASVLRKKLRSFRDVNGDAEVTMDVLTKLGAIDGPKPPKTEKEKTPANPKTAKTDKGTTDAQPTA